MSHPSIFCPVYPFCCNVKCKAILQWSRNLSPFKRWEVRQYRTVIQVKTILIHSESTILSCMLTEPLFKTDSGDHGRTHLTGRPLLIYNLLDSRGYPAVRHLAHKKATTRWAGKIRAVNKKRSSWREGEGRWLLHSQPFDRQNKSMPYFSKGELTNEVREFEMTARFLMAAEKGSVAVWKWRRGFVLTVKGLKIKLRRRELFRYFEELFFFLM